MWLDLPNLWTTIGIFDQEIKSYDHIGIWTPYLPFRKWRPFPLGNAAYWGLSHFCTFFLQWVIWVRSKVALVACYRLTVSIFYFLLEVDLF